MCTILIRDVLSGRLRREYVSTFLQLVGVLAPGRHVVLTDGSHGIIVETRKDCALTPIVETEEGQKHDLSTPLPPALAEVGEEAD